MNPAANKPDRETLRRLYEDERLTTRAIGEKFNVRHSTIRRWLNGYGIAARPSGRGLVNRGQTEPTRDELYNLVYLDRLSYRKIAARYGVDLTAIPYWLDKHGIPRPTNSRSHRLEEKLPRLDELRHRRGLGESIRSIAASCGVDHSAISRLCRANGIEVDRDGWKGGQRLPCLDGHEARSVYEQRVDDWLSQRGISHEVEPRYPFDSRYRADFLVAGTYIEIWGVTNSETYNSRKAQKIALCSQHGVPLIGINGWQFAKGRRWWRPLEKLLLQNPTPHLF